MAKLKPRIYVACTAANKNGLVHGEWINARQFTSDIEIEIQKMLAASPIPDAKEWEIYDSEDFDVITITTNMNIATIACIAKFIADYGRLGAAVLNHVLSQFDEREDLNEEIYEEVDDAGTILEEKYLGEHDSREDFVKFHCYEVHGVCKSLENYINWEELTDDWFSWPDGEFFSFEVNDMVHVFCG